MEDGETGWQNSIRPIMWSGGKIIGKTLTDLSSSIMVEWDEDYLYVAWKVFDDKYKQISTGDEIYLGDSVEVLLDTLVQADYWNQYLDWDDYQIGVSPGKNSGWQQTRRHISGIQPIRRVPPPKVIIGTKTISMEVTG